VLKKKKNIEEPKKKHIKEKKQKLIEELKKLVELKKNDWN